MNTTHMDVLSPVSGIVQSVHVSIGQRVDTGTLLVTVESMKMEIPVEAEYRGTIRVMHAVVGQAVQEDSVLIEMSET